MLHDCLTAEELARYLEVDLNSIMDWANLGKMPGTKEGNKWWFEGKNVDAGVAAGMIR